MIINFLIITSLNRIIRLIETGVYQRMSTLETIKNEILGKIREQNMKETTHRSSDSGQKGQRVIKLDELLRGVFLIWFSGNLFALFSMIIEFLMKKKK